MRKMIPGHHCQVSAMGRARHPSGSTAIPAARPPANPLTSWPWPLVGPAVIEDAASLQGAENLGFQRLGSRSPAASGQGVASGECAAGRRGRRALPLAPRGPASSLPR